MDGVTILNEFVSSKDDVILPLVIIIGFMIIQIIIGIFAIYKNHNEYNREIINDIVGLFLIITPIYFIITVILSVNDYEPTTSYEVTISEEVSFKDFTSKYEIIEQHGEIYIVKERESNGS